MSIKFFKTETIKKASITKKMEYLLSNKKFYEYKDKKYKDHLIVNGYMLDYTQRQICYNEDKNVMVVAGAGSGKTTTMIGKIKYLTTIKRIPGKDILVISFTNESTNSFKKDLEKNHIFGIEVSTFHKLALKYLDKGKIISESFLDFIITEYLSQESFKKKILSKAFHNSDYNHIKTYLKRIITTCHSRSYSLSDFNKARNKILKQNFWKRCRLLCFLYVVMDLYYLYEEEKESIAANDFDDLIIRATSNINNYNINYKYIIVDEYQDTSLIRLRFLQALINKSKASLIVVGDDYQSIYRFNGCDLNIFLNFKKYFAYPKTFKLKNTYRNSNELIKISQKFVLKNPFQIKKNLKSEKHLNNPIKIIYYKDYNKKEMFEKLTSHVNKHYGDYLILGRNNFDIKDLDDGNYLTVHKSKGLEADNIIIINLENTLFGFPNLKKTTMFEKILLNYKEQYLYDEERRLFYVALTRTKNYVFLFVNKKNPSIFVEELIRDFNIEIISI